ncbi:diguanylate cyclase [Halomonas sp. BM-2019]|uniref:sensor domain-containing diguanylate cyclase n=1 Tax=Halomonas sp. BM-2019 TaxID=2811227 RepID=UPI001B3C4065|nr:MAG: diguanylate cyclase [Halomonas sp. BM-2019]
MAVDSTPPGVACGAPDRGVVDDFCRQLRVAVEQSPVAIAITDIDGRFQFANRCYVEITGYRSEELLGRTPAMIQSGETPERLYRELWEAILGGRVWEGELLNRRKDGQTYWARESITPVRNDRGELVSFVAVKEDITERRRQQAELALLATVFETGQATLIADAEMRIEKVNQAFTDITGYTDAEVVGQTPKLFKSGRHDAAFYQRLWRSLMEDGHWQGEIWNRNRHGEIYPLWQSITAVHDDQGRLRHFVSVFHNISERKHMEQELERQASRDHLTGAYNRRAFDGALRQAMQQAERDAEPLALLLLDIDHFKAVNDRHGHDTGDEVLRRVAERLAGSLRSTDLLARWGGEEFAILLPGTPLRGAATFAERLRSRIAESRLLGLSITVSIGLTEYRPGDAAAVLLGRVDSALYRAKRGGRNGVVIAGEPAPGEEVLW